MADTLTGPARALGQSFNLAFSRIPAGLARYLDARKILRGSISTQSRHGLDWLNFFVADIQTGFGAFVAFYLADLGWSKGQVGLALAVGTIAGLIAHIQSSFPRCPIDQGSGGVIGFFVCSTTMRQ
jgi:hypothetical protein